MVKHGKRDEKGAVTALTGFLLVAFIVLCALVVDLGGAFAVKSSQVGLVQLAREEKMTPSATLLVKNSPTPGEDIALMIADSLRDNGYNGEFKVYYYELPESETGAADRFYAYGIELSSTYRSSFGAVVGHAQIPIKTLLVSSAQPYSEAIVWRPATTYNGCWSFAANSLPTVYSFTTLSLSQLPQALQDELSSF